MQNASAQPGSNMPRKKDTRINKILDAFFLNGEFIRKCRRIVCTVNDDSTMMTHTYSSSSSSNSRNKHIHDLTRHDIR